MAGPAPRPRREESLLRACQVQAGPFCLNQLSMVWLSDQSCQLRPVEAVRPAAAFQRTLVIVPGSTNATTPDACGGRSYAAPSARSSSARAARPAPHRADDGASRRLRPARPGAAAAPGRRRLRSRRVRTGFSDGGQEGPHRRHQREPSGFTGLRRPPRPDRRRRPPGVRVAPLRSALAGAGSLLAYAAEPRSAPRPP